MARNAQAFADSLERNRVLDEELCQIRRIAQSVVTKALVADLLRSRVRS
jgi:hypothetical protein